MFGRRRHYHRRGGGGGLGLFLLGIQLMSLFNFLSRSNEFFPVTLGVLALNIVAYLRPGGIAWPSLQQACISVQGAWFQKQWQRIIYASFFHSNDYHLYYNMASFMWKAISLEKIFGSGYFLYMVCVFSVSTNLLYMAINYALAEFLDQWSYIQSCAVGFSGVIFALKVVTTHLQPSGMSMIMGVFPVPMQLACWAELVVISVLFPNVSFVGHLSGILVGLAFVSGPLKMVMDIPLSLLDGVNEGGPGGQGRSYTYRAATTGHRPPEERPRPQRTRPPPPPASTYTSYTYASGTTGYNRQNEGRDSEEEELQEAIRRSLETNSSDRGNTDPPSQRPPPYNPHFQDGSDVLSSETVVVGDESEPARSAQTNTRTSSGVVQERHSERRTPLVRDEIRAARLRRFGGSN